MRKTKLTKIGALLVVATLVLAGCSKEEGAGISDMLNKPIGGASQSSEIAEENTIKAPVAKEEEGVVLGNGETGTAAKEDTRTSAGVTGLFSQVLDLEQCSMGAVQVSSLESELVTYKGKDLVDTYDLSDCTVINLTGDSATVTGKNVDVDGSIITIKKAGDYLISGKLNDGQIVIKAKKDKNVRLILNGADINCSTSACIYCKAANKLIITLAEGSVNSLTDAKTFKYSDATKEEPNATLFADSDISVNGTGSLKVNANFNHAIRSKGKLKLVSGSLDINAVNIGLKAKKLISVAGGECSIKAARGLKSDKDIYIGGGAVKLVTSDDGIHCTELFGMDNGSISIDVGDDGIHTAGDVVINGGSVDITNSKEGIEGLTVTINGGNTSVVATDDGINAAGSNVTSSDAQKKWGRFGGNPFELTEGAAIVINGGNLYINAGGDGVDSNNNLYVNGGVTMIDGPTDNGNGAIDHNGTALVSGGVIVASGSAGMIENFSASSSQNELLIYYDTNLKQGTEVEIKDKDGRLVLAFTNAKKSKCAIVSCPEFVKGEAYTVYVDGSELCTLTVEAQCVSNGEIPAEGGFGHGKGEPR